jgi:hypothetical protein
LCHEHASQRLGRSGSMTGAVGVGLAADVIAALGGRLAPCNTCERCGLLPGQALQYPFVLQGDDDP